MTDTSGRQPWLRTVLLFGLVYFLIGFVFAALAGSSASDGMRTTWRLLAWLTSGVTFAVHVGYEHFRLVSPPRKTALHASLAVALGAFALAVGANVHALRTGSRHGLLIPALVLWPLLTGIPAYVVALVAVAGLALRRRRS
jgi:hypothetical protein